jgi:hypothetical protein
MWYTTKAKEMIVEMSKEFDEKDGFVTCEFSIHKNDIPEFADFVKSNVDLKLGRWVTMECQTCVGYHGEGYVHASIERFDTIEKIEKSSNHIRTL